MWGRRGQTWEFTWDLGLFLRQPNAKKATKPAAILHYVICVSTVITGHSESLAGCALRGPTSLLAIAL
jgi:hypothetical protein